MSVDELIARLVVGVTTRGSIERTLVLYEDFMMSKRAKDTKAVRRAQEARRALAAAFAAKPEPAIPEG
jgi:hypothetical protein